MYEKFTEQVHEVMRLANEAALSFGKDDRIDTHHILLGLLNNEAGAAADILNAHRINLRRVRDEIERLGECGAYQDRRGKLPMAAPSKNVIEHSLEEAGLLGHSLVETEHLLLSLLRDQEGVAAEVFRALAADTDAIRREVLISLGTEAGG